MSRRATLRLLGILAVVGVGVLYTIFDPMESSWMPKCFFYSLTGWKCPGCGSQRLIHALFHGDFAAAFAANAFLLILIPVILGLIIVETQRRRHPALYAAVFSPRVIYIYLALILLWGLLRNLFGW